jgi:primosomal protein N' (replication factor Y)
MESSYPKRSGSLVKRVPVLLPYPLPGPFDYRVPADVDAKPGDVVLAPLNAREDLGHRTRRCPMAGSSR